MPTSIAVVFGLESLHYYGVEPIEVVPTGDDMAFWIETHKQCGKVFDGDEGGMMLAVKLALAGF